jgi:hypothetical protein
MSKALTQENLSNTSLVSAGNGTVTQPTGQQMVRCWQAYTSVRDGQYMHIVQRDLLVNRPIPQIRMSILAATLALFTVTLGAAVWSYLAGPRDSQGRHLELPSSQLDWIVQAVHEHNYRLGSDAPMTPSVTFASQHENLACTM